MNIYTRKIRGSSDLFSGFERDIDIRYYNTLEEIITYFKNELLNVFNENKLEILYQKCSESYFHIHTHNFNEILLLNPNDVIYICDNPQCL